MGHEHVRGRSEFKSCKQQYIFNAMTESVYRRFEGVHAVLLNIRVFWDETLCYWISVSRRFENLIFFTFMDRNPSFERPHYLYLQVQEQGNTQVTENFNLYSSNQFSSQIFSFLFIIYSTFHFISFCSKSKSLKRIRKDY